MKAIKLSANRWPQGMGPELIKGVRFQVAVSPYFFPERLECEYTPDHGLVILFKYIDNETAEEEWTSPDQIVTLRAGKHSGRLLEAIVHVDKHNLDSVEMFLTDKLPLAIENSLRAKKPELSENYRFAREAVSEYSHQIAQTANEDRIIHST